MQQWFAHSTISALSRLVAHRRRSATSRWPNMRAGARSFATPGSRSTDGSSLRSLSFGRNHSPDDLSRSESGTVEWDAPLGRIERLVPQQIKIDLLSFDSNPILLDDGHHT